MFDWEKLLNALGGGKSVSLGALLFAFVYMSGHRYFAEQAETIAKHREAIRDTERRLQRIEYILEAPRFTRGDGAILKNLILQNAKDIVAHEERGH